MVAGVLVREAVVEPRLVTELTPRAPGVGRVVRRDGPADADVVVGGWKEVVEQEVEEKSKSGAVKAVSKQGARSKSSSGDDEKLECRSAPEAVATTVEAPVSTGWTVVPVSKALAAASSQVRGFTKS